MLAAFAVLFVVRSRSDDDPPERTANEVTTTTSTSAPSSSFTTLPSSGTSTSLDPATPGPRTLERALVNLSDLGAGWTVDERAEQAGTICNEIDPTTRVAPSRQIKASFSRGQSGPFLTGAVADFVDDGTAGRFLDAVADTIRGCAEFTVDQGAGLTATYRLTPLSLDRGDGAVGARLTGQTAAGSVTGELLYVRVADRVATVATLWFTSEDPAVGRSALDKVVARL